MKRDSNTNTALNNPIEEYIKKNLKVRTTIDRYHPLGIYSTDGGFSITTELTLDGEVISKSTDRAYL